MTTDEVQILRVLHPFYVWPLDPTPVDAEKVDHGYRRLHDDLNHMNTIQSSYNTGMGIRPFVITIGGWFSPTSELNACRVGGWATGILASQQGQQALML